jgi:hypothetical protein
MKRKKRIRIKGIGRLRNWQAVTFCQERCPECGQHVLELSGYRARKARQKLTNGRTVIDAVPETFWKICWVCACRYSLRPPSCGPWLGRSHTVISGLEAALGHSQ